MTDSIEHKGYRITVLAVGGEYEAHTERLDKKTLIAGVSSANTAITHRYEFPQAALAAAKAAIDSGEVK